MASVKVKRTTGEILTEVLKYAADPGTLLAEDGRVCELIRAIDKFRLVQPFGTCMGIGAEIRQLAAENREGGTCPTCQTSAWRPVLVLERKGHEAREMWRPQTPKPRQEAAKVAAAVANVQLQLSAWGYKD
jgi:hypothetical protein